MRLVPQGSVRRTAVAVACLAVAGVYLARTYHHAPRVDETRSREARLQRLLDGNRNAADTAGSDREDLDRRLGLQEQLAERLEALVPSAAEVPALMEAISLEEARAGVEMTVLRPEPPEDGGPHQRWSYQLAVRGGYHAIGAFVTAIGSLEHIAAVDDMVVSAEGSASGAVGGGGVTVVASFRIHILVKNVHGAGGPGAQEGM